MAMSEQERKYLRLARTAREEGNSEDAKKFYDLVRTENPENGEAKFFYLVYKCWDGVKGQWGHNYTDFLRGAASAAKNVSKMEITDAEKGSLLEEMVTEALSTYQGMLKVERDLHNGEGYVHQYNKPTIMMLYELGDAIAETFPTNKSAMDAACEAWKNGLSLNQRFYAGIDKSLPDQYEAKILKVDPTYTKPKKGGCIKLA